MILEFHVFRRFWPILANQKHLLWHVWDSRWAFLPFWSTHFATLNSQWRPLWAPLGTLRWPVWPSWAHVGKLPKNNQKDHFFRLTFWSLFWKMAHAIRSRLCSPNRHFTLNSDTIFWAQKKSKDRNGCDSQGRHLRHIKDKGGTTEIINATSFPIY